MFSSKVPSVLMSGDVDCTVDESIGFLPAEKHAAEGNMSNIHKVGSLLTREDLIKVEAEEPCWRRARWVLLIIFWTLWLGLLATAIIVIVFTPKCPPRPTLGFWQTKVAYWVDPFAFKDSGTDRIGDLRGLSDSVNYIRDTVGAGYVILGSFLSGYFTNNKSELNLVDNLNKVDSSLGSMEDFRALVKAFHRAGLEVVITLDFNAVSMSHPWVNETSLLKRTAGDERVCCSEYTTFANSFPEMAEVLSLRLEGKNFTRLMGMGKSTSICNLKKSFDGCS